VGSGPCAGRNKSGWKSRARIAAPQDMLGVNWDNREIQMERQPEIISGATIRRSR
jgi:hypothetical protein